MSPRLVSLSAVACTFRTNSQLRRLEDQLATAPLDYKREEGERMAR
ncbi:MAG: hypothetical protein U1F27_05015 [Turneriella sp.]